MLGSKKPEKNERFAKMRLKMKRNEKRLKKTRENEWKGLMSKTIG